MTTQNDIQNIRRKWLEIVVQWIQIGSYLIESTAC